MGYDYDRDALCLASFLLVPVLVCNILASIFLSSFHALVLCFLVFLLLFLLLLLSFVSIIAITIVIVSIPSI